MELSSADFIVIAVLVGVGCVLSFAGLWVMLRQAVSARQQATESRLDELTGTLKALEAKVAELGKSREKLAATTPVAQAEAPAADTQQAAEPDEEATPEMLVVIAAAVTAFLGKKVRIRSAKKLGAPREALSSWSQHGRVLVHGSHNPRSRG
ncbi:MAG: hypothetical protein ABR905_12045 [Terracidiphilus sp.]